VRAFVRAINLTLDEEEDMALMDLARLITHPDRFVQPVKREILNEESDEPELILESHLQSGISQANALDLLKGKITHAEELVNLQLDTARNRLLYINTLVSVVSLCVAMSSLVGSVFGMNLKNNLETDDKAFLKVVAGTRRGSICESR